MTATPEDSTPTLDRGASFRTTQWSVVLSAGQGPDHAAEQALECLCRAYWFPLYAFVRRQGRTPEEAQDLTQEFFTRLLERDTLRMADRSRGRFRTFLLTALRNFLTEEWRRANRQKRGGGREAVHYGGEDAENRYSAEPRDELSPDRLYERRWAEVLLERVLARLRRDYESTGRAEVYSQLEQFLWGRQAAASYAEMGERLQLSESAVKVAVHRLRHRFRELLRAEVAQTVESDDEVDDELRHLLATFGS